MRVKKKKGPCEMNGYGLSQSKMCSSNTEPIKSNLP